MRYAKTGELAKDSDSVIKLLIGNYFKLKLRFWPYPLVLPTERVRNMCMTRTKEIELNADGMNYIQWFMIDNNLEPNQPFCVDNELYIFDEDGNLNDVTDDSETQQGYYDRLDVLMSLLKGEKKPGKILHMLLSKTLGLKPNTKYKVISVSHTSATGVASGSCIGGIKIEKNTEKVISYNPGQCDIKDIVYYLLNGWFVAKEEKEQ